MIKIIPISALQASQRIHNHHHPIDVHRWIQASSNYKGFWTITDHARAVCVVGATRATVSLTT